MSYLEIPSLTKNIIATLLRQISSIIIGLGLSIFLARTLGPEGNGLYALAILLPTLLTSFFNLGIAPANVYFISRGEVSVTSAFYMNFIFAGCLSLFGLLAGIVMIFFFRNLFFPDVPKLLLWLSLIVFPVSLIQSFSLSLFQGLQDFTDFNKILIVTPIINFILVVVMLWIVKSNVLGALIAYILTQILSLFLTIFFLQTYFIEREFSKSFIRGIKKSLSYGWKAHISNILGFLNYRLDIFLVNYFLDPVATGVYSIAVQIAERLWIFSGAVSTVLLPRLSELHTNEAQRSSLTPIIARWVFLITFLFAVFFALVSNIFIKLLFGEDFIKVNLILLYLLPGIVAFSLSKILANDLAARGKLNNNLYTAFLTVVINVVANLILIPRWGTNGAAIATTISYSMNTLINVYFYSKYSQNKWWKSMLIGREDFILIKKILQN